MMSGNNNLYTQERATQKKLGITLHSKGGFTHTPNFSVLKGCVANNTRKKNLVCGFTIIELIVVVFLIVIFTTTVLLRQGSFQSIVLLRDTAYGLALSIREAQVYGVGVRRDPTDVVSGRYGMHIGLDTPELTILYTDSDEDNVYGDGELRQTNLFEEPFSVVNLCFTHASGVEECSESVSSITGLEILFVRPDPDAHLYLVRTGNVTESVSKAKISIGAPSGKYVDVVVSKTGQVAVP